ncbi:unnamed protein product [Clonostachys rosea f. rosea IK726]|uniref:Uncharacterized protein n=1 Tax=Clonostachys rosea f. rosea IK726 TaxID=1349383 RepID=A0ACA9TXV6_BIOOC|nr:unnamed protein product [Clonostachys rosea f. rosea IK726]
MSTTVIAVDVGELDGMKLPSRRGHALGSCAHGLLAPWSTPANVSGKKDNVMQDVVASLPSPSTCISSAAGRYSGGIRRLAVDLELSTTRLLLKLCFPNTSWPSLIVAAGHHAVPNDNASFSTSSGSPRRHTHKEGIQANHRGDGGGQHEEWRGHGGGEGPSRRTQTDPSETSEYWACPFYKFDPIRHWSCYRKYNLKRLADVKSHIMRAHVMSELYCPNCFREFDDTQEWRQHCSLPVFACPQVQGPEPLFQEDFHALGDVLATAQGLSEADKWYLLFDHIFPAAVSRRPASPFVSLSFDEPLGVMRAHASRQEQLHRSILSVLQRHQIPLGGITGPNALQLDLVNAVLPISAAATASKRFLFWISLSRPERCCPSVVSMF